MSFIQNIFNKPRYESATPEQVAAMIKNGECALLDVRTRGEYLQHRIDGAQLIPIQELHQRIGEVPTLTGKKLVIICEHGVRSAKACSVLTEAGWTLCVNMSGGMANWLDCNLPVVSGEC